MSRRRERARKLIDRVEERDPEVVVLARDASLAVSVEPELLRRLRLELQPETHASVEADLWFGPLVRARGADGFVMRDAVVELLREELAADPPRLARVRELVEAAHTHLPVLIRQEERLVWLALRAETTDIEIQRELNKLLRAIVDPRRPNLAGWARRALPTLPSRVRDHGATQILTRIAGMRTARRVKKVEDVAAATDWLSVVRILDEPDVEIPVRLVGETLRLGVAGPGAETLTLPASDPLLVEVSYAVDGERHHQLVGVEPGVERRVEVRTEELRIKTTRREVFGVARREAAEEASKEEQEPRPAQPEAGEPAVVTGWALSIGVGSFDDTSLEPVSSAAKNATRVAAAFARVGFEAEVHVDPTRADILERLSRLEPPPHGVAWIHYVGHLLVEGGEPVLATKDSSPTAPPETGLGVRWLVETLGDRGARRVLLTIEGAEPREDVVRELAETGVDVAVVAPHMPSGGLSDDLEDRLPGAGEAPLGLGELVRGLTGSRSSRTRPGSSERASRRLPSRFAGPTSWSWRGRATSGPSPTAMRSDPSAWKEARSCSSSRRR
jgi:hypothetical protein